MLQSIKVRGEAVGSALEWAEVPQAEPRLGDLVRRMAKGDGSALGALYDATSRQVYGLALRILDERGPAEEVTVEVFTQIWQRSGSYDPTRSPVLGWILMLTRSRAIDRLRSGAQRRRREAPLEEAGAEAAGHPSPEEAAFLEERGRLVRAALQQLTPEQRQLIELAYFSGLTQSELAECLEQPLGTVKTRMRAAMIHLRELLQPLAQEQTS